MKRKLDLQIKEVTLNSKNSFDVAGSEAPCGGPCASDPCCGCYDIVSGVAVPAQPSGLGIDCNGNPCKPCTGYGSEGKCS